MQIDERCCWVRVVVVILMGTAASSRAAAGEEPRQLRQFAPGVETTILPDLRPDEMVSQHDVVELRRQPKLEWSPHFTPTSRTLWEMAAGAKFRRTLWGLEFSFKPLRMMAVDIPQPSGKMQRKLIWYMVFRVKNVGRYLVPQEEKDGTYTASQAAESLRFIPHFVLESLDHDKAYLDRVIPAAVGPIESREMRGQRLLTTAEMAQEPVLPSTDGVDRSVWGVVTWEDIHPYVDYFAVYVQGLTNAYRWTDSHEAEVAGGGQSRRFERKTLQLNFWRPGDEVFEHEGEIRYGTPRDKSDLYGVPEGVDYRWIYR